jgi:uncharacterized Tic20 family protein
VDQFWGVLQWKMLVYSMALWSFLLPFGVFCGDLVYFSPPWYFRSKKNLATLLGIQGLNT